MRHTSRSTLQVLGTLLVLVMFCSLQGCALSQYTTSQFKTASHRESQVQSFSIDYTLRNASRELDPWSSFADNGSIQHTSWSASDKPSPVNHRSVDLKVEFPHPTGDRDSALATLKVYSQPLSREELQVNETGHWMPRWLKFSIRNQKTSERPLPQEIITLELTRKQFELLLNELNRDDYLDETGSGKSQESSALLSVTRDHRLVHNSQIIDARLNELIRHIYQDGQKILGEKVGETPSVLQASGISAPAPVSRQ